jgi:hypothetical protein
MKKVILFCLLFVLSCREKTYDSRFVVNEFTVFDTKHNKLNVIKDSIQISRIWAILKTSVEIEDSIAKPNWIYEIELHWPNEMIERLGSKLWLYDTNGIIQKMRHDEFPRYKVKDKDNLNLLLRTK